MNDTATIERKATEMPDNSIDSIIDKVNPVVGLSGLGGADSMRERLRKSAEERMVIEEFIMSNFTKGIDYGPADTRNPKDTLLKPGAEKACILFDCHPEWKRDDEVWEMFGKIEGLICLKCLIVDNKTGAIIGEGRGSEKVGNKARDANKTTKAAEKCSLVDAVLYTFALSERFTQDDGKGKVTLDAAGNKLLSDIGEWRRGCGSSLSDVKFFMIVNMAIVHKKTCNTVAELDAVRKMVLEEFKFDKLTGERIPDNI